MHDHHGNEVLDMLMLLVAGGYLIIAIQFLNTLFAVRKSVNKRSAVSLALLMFVFLFCATSGYIGRALDFSDKTEIILHCILILCTFGFIATNQISVILHGLKNGND